MTIVAADAYATAPLNTTCVDINAGQRHGCNVQQSSADTRRLNDVKWQTQQLQSICAPVYARLLIGCTNPQPVIAYLL